MRGREGRGQGRSSSMSGVNRSDLRLIWAIIAVSVFLLLTPMRTTGSEDEPSEGPPGADEPRAEPASSTIFERLSKGFSLHKDNYILLGTWQNEATKTEDSEIKFQFSFKQEVWKGFYFAYTQKSFWRWLDGDDSRPFRETNYNPEIFYRRLPRSDTTGLRWGGDIGVEHESNGAREPTSRSWNRLYVAPTVIYRNLETRLKVWYRFEEEVKTDPADTHGDENPDIEDFYGYGELSLTYTFLERWQVSLLARHNFPKDKGALQVDLSVPTPVQDLYFFGQLFTGYGESLIDYNESFTRYGFGLLFRQSKKTSG